MLPAAAGSLKDEMQMWNPVYLDFPILNKRIRGYFEVQPRLGREVRNIDQLLVRSALGYYLRPNLGVYSGYVWVPNWEPFKQEHRLWQQAGYGWVMFKRIQMLGRFRMEERFLEGVNGASLRQRYMLRAAIPILQTRFYWTAYNELFVNLNQPVSAPRAGVDQNRFYTGLGRQWNRNLRTEVGYMLQYVNRSDPFDDQGRQILVTQTFIDF